MAQVLIYTNESVSSKYRQIIANSIITSLHLGYSITIPHQVVKMDIIGDDNDFSRPYKRLFDKFKENTLFGSENELKKGDIIKVDNSDVIEFSHYDKNMMCIVSNKGGQYLKYIEHTTLEESVLETEAIEKKIDWKQYGKESLVMFFVLAILHLVSYLIGDKYYSIISTALLGIYVTKYIFLSLKK